MDKARIRIAALSAMTQTCMALRHIAQPYLYHYPCVRAPVVYQLLLRTLVERPDLAQYINELSAFDMTCDDIRLISRIQPHIRHVEERMVLRHTRECDRYHDPPSRGKRVDIKYDVNTLFTTIVLPFGTSLQTLHLELSEDCEFPSCEPGSLPQLKELVVKNWDAEESLAIRVIASILIASPALERLGGLKIFLAEWEGPQPPIHEDVKEIWFEQSVLGPEGVAVLLGLFPRLEAFTYESDDDNSTASVSEIGEALLACQDLRFLSLDFTNCQNGGEVYPTNQPRGGSLAELKKLQKFCVKGLTLFRETEWLGRSPITISNMLPTSITELEVTRPSDIIFDDLLELSGVASQRFPLLKHVSIDGIEQECEVFDWRQRVCMGLESINKLRQAFGQSGIELSTGDFGKFVGFF